MSGLKKIDEARYRFLRNLYPRERWTPSQWAENCRELSAEESSEPGMYSFDRTPYWRFVLDLITRPGVELVLCRKGFQIGWSELCRNAIGFWVDCDPAPIMLLAADRKSTEDLRDERIEPLIANTKAVSRHMSGRAWDAKKFRIKFDTCSLFLTWAGSKTGTKSRPIGRLVCEEPDEFPAFSSTGGDPLAKALKRLATFRDKGRARVLIGGTPTSRLGNIWKQWELCAVRYWYWVPCPHCGAYQTLQWKQVWYPKLEEEPDVARRAERVKRELLAHYKCEQCSEPILDHHKPDMLRRGVWATEDQVVTPDGRVTGLERESSRIGICISGLYSPWASFSEIAAEWIGAQGNTHALADFVNQWLAEPFEDERQKVEPVVIQVKANGAPAPMVIPDWAEVLIATADTQGADERNGYFWYVVRAWAGGYRSQLIDYGIANTKADLIARTIDRGFPIDSDGTKSPRVLLVDSGGPRWSEIYQFALSYNRIRPTKGAPASRTWMVTERPQRKHKVVLWEIDTEQSKDLLHRLINDPDKTLWLPHSDVGDDYIRQMTSESKIFDPRAGILRWEEIVKNNNHIWDCEQQQCAAAWRLCAGAAPDPNQTQGWWSRRKKR